MVLVLPNESSNDHYEPYGESRWDNIDLFSMRITTNFLKVVEMVKKGWY